LAASIHFAGFPSATFWTPLAVVLGAMLDITLNQNADRTKAAREAWPGIIRTRRGEGANRGPTVHVGGWIEP
jgi:hypothetical protein